MSLFQLTWERQSADEVLVLLAESVAYLDAVWAERYLQAAISLCPENSLARYRLGKLRMSQGDLEGAAESFAGSLHLLPDHVPTRFALAQCICALGLHEEGLIELETVLRDAPAHPGALSLKFRTFLEVGRYEEASALYDAEPQLREPRANRVLYARLCRRLGKTEEYEATLCTLKPSDLKKLARQVDSEGGILSIGAHPSRRCEIGPSGRAGGTRGPQK